MSTGRYPIVTYPFNGAVDGVDDVDAGDFLLVFHVTLVVCRSSR